MTKALKLTAKYGDYDPKIKTFAISGYELLSFMNDCKKEFSDNNITNARKAEALICGQTIGELLKLWFVNYENKNNWN